MSSINTYVINGVSSYGLGTTVAQLAEQGLSLTTSTDNFSMNGLGFLYNGLGATWADVRQKVQDLKAVVAPPDITTLTVNNRIQVTNGVSTTTINPASITSTTFTGALVGNADTATTASTTNNVNNAGVTTGGPYGVAYMNNSAGTTFISSDTAGSHLTFNPSSNTLATRNLTISGSATALSVPNATAISFPSANVTATTFTGALTGNASTATTATNATNTTITADNTTAVTYPTFVNATSGDQTQRVDTDLRYNCATNTLTVTNVTATTFTGALAGNATSATTATSATSATSASLATTASNLTALNPITPSYSYPVSSPSLIGWIQVITATGRTYTTVNKAFCCNTTALVAGIYIMRPYIYAGNSSWYSGFQLLSLVASNSFINNDATTGWIEPSNSTPMGYLQSRLPSNSGDGIQSNSFIVNNTGAGFYPYWAVAVLQQTTVSPAGSCVPQMNFYRIA
jgi:hypothetical protein